MTTAERPRKKPAKPAPKRDGSVVVAREPVRTPEIEAAILAAISEGIPLRQFCRENPISKTTVYDWLDNDPEFAGRFARARARGFDQIAEEALEIANTPLEGVEQTIKVDGAIEEKRADMLGHRKLQIETRLKLLAKWDPKRYGEKLDVTVEDITDRAEQMRQRRERRLAQSRPAG